MYEIKKTYQGELSKNLVVSSHLSLTLTNFDLYLSLSISSGGENLRRTREKLIYCVHTF